MTEYRVVVVSKVREYYLVEADDEAQAVAIATEHFTTPAVAEPVDEPGEVELVEEA